MAPTAVRGLVSDSLPLGYLVGALVVLALPGLVGFACLVAAMRLAARGAGTKARTPAVVGALLLALEPVLLVLSYVLGLLPILAAGAVALAAAAAGVGVAVKAFRTA